MGRLYIFLLVPLLYYFLVGLNGQLQLGPLEGVMLHVHLQAEEGHDL